MAQAVLMPVEFKASMKQVGLMLGVCEATVWRLRHDLRRKRLGKYQQDARGGRQRQNMSLEEEKTFLEQWQQRAKSGELVVACEMREALAKKLGRGVCESYVYRVLGRHGWRKLAPDTRHPKADAPRQEEWKKNSRKIWQPCASRSEPRLASCA